jgi:DNA repair protein RadC
VNAVTQALPKKKTIGGVLFIRDDFGAYVPASSRSPDRIRIRTPADCLPALLPYRGARTECFLVVTLDASHTIIRVHEVTRGLVDRSLVHPREVFQRAVEDLAAAIIVAHNHPSGSLDPSAEDLVATRKLVGASKVLGIPVLDHLIFTKEGFNSIKERFPDYFTQFSSRG